MFTNPNEFAASLYSSLRKPVPHLSSTDHLDEGWKKITWTRFDKSKFGKRYTREQAHNYVLFIDNLREEIQRGFSDEIRNKLNATVSFGILDSGEINASIYKDRKTGYCAIFFNLGIIQFFSLYLQLREAYFRPQNVIYCTRGNPQDLDKSDYAKFMDEHFVNYLKDDYPNGPKIHLNKEANNRVGRLILIKDLFILAHEIGHFVNGDLDGGANFEACKELAGVEFFAGNSYHEREFAADDSGFKIVAKTQKIPEKKYTAGDLLMSSLCVFFCGLYTLNPRESATHPCSLDRCLQLAHKYCSPIGLEACINDVRRTRESIEQ